MTIVSSPSDSGVDGGCEPCRPGADDGDVVEAVRVDRLGQAEIVGERRRRGVAQHPMVRRDHDGELVGRELETVEEPAGVRIDLGVEQAVRVAVAHQEALEAQGIAAVPGPDQHDGAMRVPNEPDPPEDEGPHDDLADVRLAGHQTTKVGALDPDYPAVHAGATRHQYLSIVEQVEFAGELALGMDREDVRLASGVEVEDLDVALEHEEEVDRALAALEDERALREPFLGAVGRNPRGHLLAQPREGLRLAGIRVARIEIRLRPGRSVRHEQENRVQTVTRQRKLPNRLGRLLKLAEAHA